MTERAWDEGLKYLLANLPGPELTQPMAEVRGRSYREDLDHLSDDVWLWTCRQARKRFRFFPVIADLLALAEEAPRPHTLPPRPLTPEETAARRKELHAERMRNLVAGAGVLRTEGNRLGVDVEPLVAMVMGRGAGPRGASFKRAAPAPQEGRA